MRTPSAALATAEPVSPWLLLLHQLPGKPSRARVSTWRRLQKVGALALKNSAYVLPNSPQAREDLEWIKAEIVEMGGQATVFAADSVDSLTNDQIAAAFRTVRERDFLTLRREIEKLLARHRRTRAIHGVPRQRLERAQRLLRQRWAEIVALDFFAAAGREEAAAALDELERLLAGRSGGSAPSEENGGLLMKSSYRARVWVTRPRPGIDRMASAWLIRRFIDPRARFAFAERASNDAEAVPFDMYGVEFSHQGNACTFETLARRFGISHPAVEWLGRLVHDLDLKDERYRVPEAAAVGRLVDGLRQMVPDDAALLEQGMTVFEALYRSHAGHPAERHGSAKRASRRRAAR